MLLFFFFFILVLFCCSIGRLLLKAGAYVLLVLYWMLLLFFFVFFLFWLIKLHWWVLGLFFWYLFTILELTIFVQWLKCWTGVLNRFLLSHVLFDCCLTELYSHLHKLLCSIILDFTPLVNKLLILISNGGFKIDFWTIQH